MSNETSIALFNDKEVRKTLHKNEWWFCIIDVVEILTDSVDAGAYWRKLKQRLLQEGGDQTVTNCHSLKMTAKDGKQRNFDAMKTEDILRLIQSIPSPKAEPFKRWLAQVGSERIAEIDNPELATERMRKLYEAKGYSKGWIDKRVRGINVRDELTSEWKQRGVKEGREYAILTNDISKATFGMTATEYKKHKSLQLENLRDHMTDLELIFTMLGEAATTEIARNKDAQGFWQNKMAANQGGKIAGDARGKLEKESGKRVVSKGNYLDNNGANKLK